MTRSVQSKFGNRFSDDLFLERFVQDAFEGVRRSSNNQWIAGGGEDVSYAQELHTENGVYEEDSFWFKQRNEIFLSLVQKFDLKAPLLDVGGGTGIVGNHLTENGFPTINLEPTASGASLAMARGVPTILSTLQNSGVRKGSLASVGLFDVLEHIEDEHGALRQIHEALRPGGHLIVAVPAHSWLWSLEDNVAGHYRRYNRRSLEKSLIQCGFEAQYISHIFSYLVAPVFAMRAIPTLWGTFGSDSQENKRRLHRPKDLTARVVRWLGETERRWVEAGRRLRFGTSVLAVAHKPERS